MRHFAGAVYVVVQMRYPSAEYGAQRLSYSAQYNVKATGHVVKLRRELDV